jgi:ribose 5-phosphate isomerase B
MGGRILAPEEAWVITTTFLDTPFSEDPRHIRRIDQVTTYEKSRVLPPLPAL